MPCTENKPYTAPSDKYRIHTHIIPQVLAFAGATEYNMYCQVRHSRCVWRNPSVYRGCGGSNTTSLLALFCPASIIYGFRPKSNTYFGFPGHFRAKQPTTEWRRPQRCGAGASVCFVRRGLLPPLLPVSGTYPSLPELPRPPHKAPPKGWRETTKSGPGGGPRRCSCRKS